jgi:hypothetical protein
VDGVGRPGQRGRLASEAVVAGAVRDQIDHDGVADVIVRLDYPLPPPLDVDHQRRRQQQDQRSRQLQSRHEQLIERLPDGTVVGR